MIKFRRFLKRLSSLILALLLILVIVFFSIQKKSKDLIPNRIALIDKIGNNYIFRGNNPFVTKNNKKNFTEEELISHFNDILRKQNYSELKDYDLIDFSLLDLDEYFIIKKEEHFFERKLNNDSMLINISTLSPALLFKRSEDSNALVKYIANKYSLKVTDIINEIHNQAAQQKQKPIVIYIHCNGGRDRTGLIAASYRMQFQNMNLSQAISKNIEEVGRNSEDLYKNAIYSYCLHIKETQHKNTDFCD
jgi:hypothetical protein